MAAGEVVFWKATPSREFLVRTAPSRLHSPVTPPLPENVPKLNSFSSRTTKSPSSLCTQGRRGVDGKQLLPLRHTLWPWYSHAACLLSVYTSSSIRWRRHLHTAESCNKLAKGLQRIVAPGAILLPLLVGTCAMYSPLCQSVEEPAQCLHSPHHRNVWRSRLGRAAGLRAGLTSEQR